MNLQCLLKNHQEESLDDEGEKMEMMHGYYYYYYYWVVDEKEEFEEKKQFVVVFENWEWVNCRLIVVVDFVDQVMRMRLVNEYSEVVIYLQQYQEYSHHLLQ